MMGRMLVKKRAARKIALSLKALNGLGKAGNLGYLATGLAAYRGENNAAIVAGLITLAAKGYAAESMRELIGKCLGKPRLCKYVVPHLKNNRLATLFMFLSKWNELRHDEKRAIEAVFKKGAASFAQEQFAAMTLARHGIKFTPACWKRLKYTYKPYT
ncbi:MAG TPA: hypothetical protein HA254_03425 [Candidatus Diapherotrites archaeon]|uniref:Uncharacterized protein n=1 Tax=Candidatus Iainarchaeum sp. TaxID=3101447 RepID=A0A7J4IZK9_9ARCH|nr:hypothetical protein [Candidatus Diapherotrites archaeon]